MSVSMSVAWASVMGCECVLWRGPEELITRDSCIKQLSGRACKVAIKWLLVYVFLVKLCCYCVQLKVREHPRFGPYVEGLSAHVVTSYDDISSWLSVGNKRRATAATSMNDTSSRSHSVFSLLLTKTTVSYLLPYICGVVTVMTVVIMLMSIIVRTIVLLYRPVEK